MGVFDAVFSTPTQPSAPATPPSNSGGVFSSVFSKAPDGSPAPTPTSPTASTPKGIFSSVFSSPKNTPTPSPYWAGADSFGDTFGPSATLDASGKPLLDYKKSGDQSTTTDKTRVDTNFDPMTAQPEKQSDIATTRTVSSSEKADIKENAGAPKSDVIDHAMALTVAGSNEPENLRPETNDLNEQQGTFEEDLDNQVKSGKISLFDAQKLEAANKGLPTPFTGAQAPSFWDSVKSYLGNVKTPSQTVDASYGLHTLASYLINKSTGNTGSYDPQNPTASGNTAYLKTFFKSIPNAVAENLPFGVGDVVKQIDEDPENAANLSLDDVVQSLPQAGKDFISGMIVQPALTIAGAVLAPFMGLKNQDSPQGGQLTVNIPGLGSVSNLQADVANKVEQGENPWQAALDETPGAIFDTLAAIGIAGKFLGPREVTVLKGQAPDGMKANEGPQSFKEYKPPVSNTPIPNDVLQKIIQEKGITLGKNYDPQYPTYFRIAGDAQGTMVTPSIVQIQPSFLDTFLNKFHGNASMVPPNMIIPLYNQPIRVSDIIAKAKEAYANMPNKQGGFIKIPGEDNQESEEDSGSGQGSPSKSIDDTNLPDTGTHLPSDNLNGQSPPEALSSILNVSPSHFTNRSFISEHTTNLNKQSQVEEPDFKKGIEDATGLKADTRIKPDASTEGKINRYIAKGNSKIQINDHLAGRIVVPSESDIYPTVKNLRGKFNVRSVQNYFANEHPVGLGYKGVNIQIKLPSGYPAELQIHTPESLKALNQVHPIYEKYRDVDTTKFTDEEKQQYYADKEKAQSLTKKILNTKKPENVEKANNEYTNQLQKDEVEASKNDIDLHHAILEREILREAISNNPSRQSVKNTNKRTGELPEVTGKGKEGSFSKSGDSMSTERGFSNSEEERAALDDYRINKTRIKALDAKISDMRKKGVNFRNSVKNKNALNKTLSKTTEHAEEPNEEYLKAQQAKKKAVADQLARNQADAVTQFFIDNPDVLEDYEETGKINEEMDTYITEYLSNLTNEAQEQINLQDAEAIEQQSESDKDRKLDQIVEEYKQKGVTIDRDILEDNKGVVPPAARGGIRSPQFDVTELKDIAMLRLNRDTLERGFEKITSPQIAAKLNKFYIEKIRDNDFKMTQWKNAIREKVGKRMKELGIKAGSKESAAVQKFGEGVITAHELDRELPEMSEKIQEADREFRKVFDSELGPWNEERVKFGYKPVQPVGNRPYYRHFNKKNPWLGITGSFFQSGELPTEIAGLTDNFNPGKSFTGAELHRTGNKTQYDAITSLDDWLDSVGRQRFHIDSIQRGRAIEKYIRATAKVNPEVHLPNFVANLHEHTNFIAGKSGRFDRAVEELAGRRIVGFFQDIKNAYGANVIGANLASAFTHGIPVSFNLATVNTVGAMQGLFDTLTSPFAEDFLKVDGIDSKFLTRRYPIKNTRPNKFQRITHAISTPFDIVDRFISRLAVSSKYYEGTHYGLSKEDAMARADTYAGKVIGSRGTGDLPNLMNNKTLGFFTQFQIEVNDNMSVLIHDIPRFSREDIPKGESALDMIEEKDSAGNSHYKPRGNNYGKIAKMLILFAVFSHLVNHFLKALRGIGKGLDPIGLGLDLAGYNDDAIPFIPQKNVQDSSLGQRAIAAGTDFLGELPGTNILTGSIPAAGAFPNILAIAQGKSTFTKEGLKAASGLVSPVGGGAQLEKTVEGINAVNKGKTTTSNGQTNTVVKPTAENYVRGAVFGPSAFNNANGGNKQTSDLINMLDASQGKNTAEAEQEYAQLKSLPKADAEKQFGDLIKSNPAMAKLIQGIAKDDANGITLNERLIKQLGVTDGQRAQYIANEINGLSDKKSKAALWERYVTIKIISPQVAKQIATLLKK